MRKYRVGPKQIYSCKYGKHKSLSLYYYLFIFVSFFSFKAHAFIYLYFYCGSIKVVPIFLPLLSPALPTPPTPASSISPHTVVHYHGSFIHVPRLDPSPSFPCHFPPPWFLSVCSLFPCLWFYFAHLFVLFIRFHLQVSHMVFVFCRLACYTQHNTLVFHTNFSKPSFASHCI